MDERATSIIATTSAELAVLAAKGTVSAVSSKLKQIRSKKDRDVMANAYEEVITELIQERNEAISIAQSYQDEVKRYQISDEDIQHLQAAVQSVLDLVREMSPETDLSSFDQARALISVDTLKAMQLLGFDYRAGIGEPLTIACAKAIERNFGMSGNPSKGTKGNSNMSRGR